MIYFDSKNIYSLETLKYIQIPSTWSSQAKLFKHWYEIQTWTYPKRHRHPDKHLYSHCFIKTQCSFRGTSRNIFLKMLSVILKTKVQESVIWNLKDLLSCHFLCLEDSINTHHSKLKQQEWTWQQKMQNARNIMWLQHLTCYSLCFLQIPTKGVFWEKELASLQNRQTCYNVLGLFFLFTQL